MSDTTPPRLTSLTFPGAVNLLNGSQTITFTAGATDDSSGIQAIIINFASTLSSVYIFASGSVWTTGTGFAQDTIAVNTPPGAYTIASVQVFDNAGNEAVYGTSALQQLGIATTLTVSGSDTTGPALTALSFDPVINLANGDATFHFSASATDRSGVGSAILYFNGGPGNEYIFGSAADPWTDGTSASTGNVRVSTPAGVYQLSEVDLTDTAGNTSVYSTAQLQALGLPTSVTVTGSDTVGPTLTALSFDPQIDLSAGAATFHFGASATDRSGVGSVDLYFDGGPGAQYIFGSTADPWTDGSSASTSTIAVSTPPGVYHLTEVDLYDTAGNQSVYTTAQLQALGFATTVTVSASDVTGPTLTGFTHPTNVSLAGGATTLTLGVSATDRSGIGSAAVYFDKSLFGPGGATAFLFGTTADPWTDGSSTVVETVPTSVVAGVYTVTSLQVTDTAGNVSTYTTAQLAALGYATTITVGGVDTTAPNLTSLSFPATVNVATSAQSVTFAAAGTDNATGIKDVKLTFDKSFSGGTGPGILDIAGTTGDPWTDGASTLTQTLGVSTLPGVYTVTGAVVTDGAGNVHSYTTAQLQTLGFSTHLTVVGDVTKPTLGSLLFPATIDVTTGQRVAPFTATASDNATGVRDVSVRFDKDLLTGLPGGVVDLNGIVDSWSDGSSTLNFIVPVTAVAGVYTVTSVVVTDGAGNVATYDPAQLAALGVASSLTIVSGQHGAPAITFPSVVTYGGGGSVTFSGSVTDTVSLTSVKVYSGATFIGAATINAATHTWTLTTTLATGVYADWSVVATDVTNVTASAKASFTLQTGIVGQAYVTVESDYTGALLVDRRYLRLDGSLYLNQTFVGGIKTADTYGGVVGKPYTSYQYDYDASGHYYDIRYYGYVGQFYTSTEADYRWSAVTKTYTRYEQKYLKSDLSLYETILYNLDGSQNITFYNIVGQAYTSYETDYDTSNHYTARINFGYNALLYTIFETDYSWSSVTLTYTVIEQKYLHSDRSLYQTAIFNSDKTQIWTYYGIVGQAYTYYEIDYDALHHYTAKKYFGYTGLTYVETEADYNWSAVTKLYTHIAQKYFRSDLSLYEMVLYNANGTQVWTYYGVTGQAYTSYEVDYDASLHYTARKYFGYTGQIYVTMETDYTWSSITNTYTKTQQKYFRADQSLYESISFTALGTQIWTYYGVAGQLYNSYEIDYDASLQYTAKKYFGYTNQPYTIIESDYTWSSASLYTLVGQKFLHTDLSLYETIAYNSNLTQIWTFYGITGQGYTSYELDYDASLHYTTAIYFGYSGQPYVKLERFYSWSSASGYTLTEDKYFRANSDIYEVKTYSASGTVDRFYGITGHTYTSDEFDYNSAGTLLREVQYSGNGLPNLIVTHNADLSTTYDYFQVTGTDYSSYEIVRDANDVERSQTFNYNDGTHQIDGEQNNITLVSTSGPDTIYGNGPTSSAFGWGVLFQFNAVFGHDLVVDFYNRTTTLDALHLADTIQLPKSEFADFQTFYNSTVDSPVGTLSTASNGDSLTLTGMTRAALLAAQSDFRFV